MKKRIIFLLILITQFTFGQNLITNPGFEICDKCGQFGNPGVEFFGTSNSNNPVDWFAPSPGSSDIREYFPFMGKKHGGFFSFGKYEYLGNVLSSPLEVGAEYSFSFNLSVEPTGYTLDEIGVAFHSGLPYYNVNSLGKTITPLFTTPDGEFLPARTYKKYSFTFKATGCEDHVIIGRFNELSNMNDTMWIGSGKPTSLISAYTFVDDVELVKIKNTEDLGLENSISLCPNESKKIGIKSGFTNVKWSTGETTDSIIVNSNSGQVCVEVKLSQSCPPIKECIQIIIDSLVNFDLGLEKSLVLCSTQSKKIGIFPSFKDVKWSTGATTDTIEVNGNSGLVCVEARQSQNCLAKKECLNIIKDVTNENINLELIDSISLCKLETLKIGIRPGLNSIKWSTEATTDSINITGNSGLVWVEAKLNKDCPAKKDSTHVTLKSDNLESLYRLPNVFTPAAMENKSFGPIIDTTFKDTIYSYQFEVYNRWGKRVFKTLDRNMKWVPDTDAPMETYNYLLISNVNGCKEVKKIKKKGSVTLIR